MYQCQYFIHMYVHIYHALYLPCHPITPLSRAQLSRDQSIRVRVDMLKGLNSCKKNDLQTAHIKTPSHHHTSFPEHHGMPSHMQPFLLSTQFPQIRRSKCVCNLDDSILIMQNNEHCGMVANKTLSRFRTLASVFPITSH